MNRRQVLKSVGSLAVLPFATQTARADAYQPLGMVSIPGAKEVVIGSGGDSVFVATTDGFAAVDVSDPAVPTISARRRDILAGREDGPLVGIQDVKVAQDRLLVAGPANHRSDVIQGFALFDVADPADPTMVAFHETDFPIHNAYLDGETAYLTGHNPVVVVDLSDDEPVEVGRWSLADYDEDWGEVVSFLWAPHDLWVRDGIAYVAFWEAGTWIIDVRDGTDPSVLGRIGGRPLEDLRSLTQTEAIPELLGAPGNHHYVQPSEDGRLLAVGKESWEVDGADGTGPSGIELWDVSTPREPIQLSEIRPPRAADETRGGTWTTAHNFDVVGDRLYSTWYQGGIKIHDISDPSAPAELAWWREPSSTAFWTARLATDAFFVASSTAMPAQGLTEGLFTFPTTPGEQSDPPSGVQPSSPPLRLGTPRPTPTPTATRTPTVTESPSRPGGSTSTSVESTGQPGFGPLAAITGVAAGAWWALRRYVQRREGKD